MIASFLGTNAFAVTGDRTAEFSPGVRVLADCGADGARYGTVAGALYAADADLTTVTLTLDADGLTASLAAVLHGNDVPASLANHGHAGPADGGLLGTATPTANAHPIASALGRLTAWIDAATTGAAGIAKLATTAMCQAGTDTTTAVTPAGLAASAKGLIASSTTIYVATTGNDATGDGSLSSPFASIAQALASIKNKLIASGVIVTIQVADGTYTISSTIVIDHPDADKIRIYGNVATETALAVSSIDTANKKFVFSGADYSSYFSVGDIFRVTSGTAANQGAYSVASVSYAGGNTEIAINEAISSTTVGGASITVMPANKCILSCSTTCFQITNCRSLSSIRGFRIQCATQANNAVYVNNLAGVELYFMIVKGFSVGIFGNGCSRTSVYTTAILGAATGVRTSSGANTAVNTCGIGSCTTVSIYADNGGFNRFLFGGLSNNANSNAPSPAFGSAGNGNGYNSNS